LILFAVLRRTRIICHGLHGFFKSFAGVKSQGMSAGQALDLGKKTETIITAEAQRAQRKKA